MFELGIGKRYTGGLFQLRTSFAPLLVAIGVAVAAPGIGCKPPEEKKDEKASKDDDKKAKDDKKDDKKKSGSSDGDDDDDDDDKKDDKKKKKPGSSDGDDDDDGKKKKDDKKKKPGSSDGDDDDDDDQASAKKKKKKPGSSDGDDDDDDAPTPKKKPASDGVDVVGAYSLKGAGPDGKTYSGSSTVSRIGAAGSEMYNVSWLIGGNTYKGIGFRDGDILSCGWTDAKAGDNDRDLGVIAFLIKDDGNTLDGVWFEPGETSLGKELLSGGTSNLTGTYTIKSGETPTTKKKYTGTVTVSLKSGVYNLLWNIGGGTSKGFGIRNGDVLSAAFTDSGGGFGVMQYRITKGGNILAGQWAQTGQSTPGTGTETMTKL